MPNLANRDNCCGCSSCANKCPIGAIVMEYDSEGFMHPVIDVDKCVNCGFCERACPALGQVMSSNNQPYAVVVQHKNDETRYESTSGGAFSAIAEEVINKGEE